MVDKIPEEFRTSAGVIVSVDFEEFASGTGYVVFKAGDANNDGTPEYILSNFDFYSTDITTYSVVHSASDPETFEVNFDIKFNLQRTIKGDLILSIPIGTYGHDQTVTGYGVIVEVSGNIYHYDGSTETSLGTFQSEQVTGGTKNVTKSQIVTMKIPIAATKFQKDEILRVEVIVEGNMTGGPANGIYGLGHDPRNRNDDRTDSESAGNKRKVISDDTDTIMEVQVPFDRDL